MIDAMQAYQAVEETVDGLFGSSITRHIAQVYKAETDGFAVANIAETKNGSRGYLRAYTDSSDSPIKMRATTSQHYYTDHDTYVPYGSLTMPVKKDDTFMVNFTPTSAAPSANLHFVPFTVALGDWTSHGFSAGPYTAAGDGFALCWLRSDTNGDRGYILGEQGDTRSNLQTLMGCSVHYTTNGDTWVLYSSLCMPVPKGHHYNFEYNGTYGNPTYQTWWIPLDDESLSFGTFSERSTDIKYLAQTDGFLMGWMNASEQNGPRGYITVSAGYSENSLSTVAQTSVHYYHTSGYHDTWIPHNSVTVPIAKGQYYKVETTNTSKTPITTLHWVPLEEASS